MAKEMPLLAEFINCLNAYQETFDRILLCLNNMCDYVHTSQDSPLIIQIQDLISIDAEWNRHLDRMESWEKRQEEIRKLEQELNGLSSKVNQYARSLNAAQCSLRTYLYNGRELQKEAQHKLINPTNQTDIQQSETMFDWLK